MARHEFSVDKHSDDDVCDTAIEQLQRMVELGKHAQLALDSIKNTGHFTGPVPIAGPASNTYWDGSHSLGHQVRFAILQKRQPYSRADLPPLDNLQLDYKDSVDGTYGGHDCIEVPLYAHGLVARQIDSTGTLKFVEEEGHLGKIRINKHHLSFVENSNNNTAQIYKSRPGSPGEPLKKYQESATLFAKRLARLMVDAGADKENIVAGHGNIYMPMAAKTLDLQNALPQWFIEDGVVERMFDEIHRYICCLRVMEA